MCTEIYTGLLDFKLSPCSECCKLSFGQFPGLWILYADVSGHSVPSSWASRYECGVEKCWDIYTVKGLAQKEPEPLGRRETGYRQVRVQKRPTWRPPARGPHVGHYPPQPVSVLWPVPTLSPSLLMAHAIFEPSLFPYKYPNISQLHVLHTYLPMKTTECFETSAYKIQTPGNYPEESLQLYRTSKRCPLLLSNFNYNWNRLKISCKIPPSSNLMSIHSVVQLLKLFVCIHMNSEFPRCSTGTWTCLTKPHQVLSYPSWSIL
jgi:hypothetical protein